MIIESTRRMTPSEQMGFDLGYAKAKEEYAAALAKAEKRAGAAIAAIKKDCTICKHKDTKPCAVRSEWMINCFEWNDPTAEQEADH